MGANVLVEFEIVFIGGIFYDWGQFFPDFGQLEANVLVEFKNVFYNWGQKIISGSRKSAILGIIWTPVSQPF